MRGGNERRSLLCSKLSLWMWSSISPILLGRENISRAGKRQRRRDRDKVQERASDPAEEEKDIKLSLTWIALEEKIARGSSTYSVRIKVKNYISGYLRPDGDRGSDDENIH